ncbi:glycosyltransferase family 2 protein [Microbacterium sp. C7(2022)]|uniref:glycosyltransferase family 2 protein n=1 Tax=Microbacterium sp. C7(2022) TaxID=2992759 RepID=UPI00237A85BB|nr:glycosyltransferase family 2 protein [Microbacterium sp. C7(2022)]MDE0545743.1 glycosyltransferase [Microbacterium sp. C7(2022)]
MTLTPAPVVTVIVPGFDVATFASEALESLRAQSMPRWQAVLVNDASADETGRIFDEYAGRDERFRVLHQPMRRGLGAARNAALERVDTEYVAFLDADDIMRPEALHRLWSSLESSGSDFVTGAYVRLRPTPTGGYAPGQVQPWVARATDPRRSAVTLREHAAASGNIVAWSKMSRIEFWRRLSLRFPEGKAYEDQVVAQRMYTGAHAFDVIPDVVVEWRERADGSSITQHKYEITVLRDYLEALEAGLDVLRAGGFDDALRERLPLIFTLDLPPLVAIGEHHPDAAYRTAIGAFVRRLDAHVEDVTLPRESGAASALELARSW